MHCTQGIQIFFVQFICQLSQCIFVQLFVCNDLQTCPKVNSCLRMTLASASDIYGNDQIIGCCFVTIEEGGLLAV